MSALKPVKITQFYNTAAEFIFDAWTNPMLIRKWLFRGPESEIIMASTNLKVNGDFSVLEQNLSNGERTNHYGRYLDMERPSRLAFTLEIPKHFAGVTTVIIEINQKDEGSELTLTQTGVAPQIIGERWRMMLQQLNTVVEQMHVE